MKTFVVHAVWDEEAKVYAVVESDVPGLTAEAATLDSLHRLLCARIPELLDENGVHEDGDIPLKLIHDAMIHAGRSSCHA